MRKNDHSTFANNDKTSRTRRGMRLSMGLFMYVTQLLSLFRLIPVHRLTGTRHRGTYSSPVQITHKHVKKQKHMFCQNASIFSQNTPCVYLYRFKY